MIIINIIIIKEVSVAVEEISGETILVDFLMKLMEVLSGISMTHL